MTKEDIVKKSLSEFLQSQSAEASISSIDEIVLTYMVGVLEELAIEDADDTFDVETFTQMMDAYLPGFCDIQQEQVCDWMCNLALQLKEEKEQHEQDKPKAKPMTVPVNEKLANSGADSIIFAMSPGARKARGLSESSITSTSSEEGGRKSRGISESSEASADGAVQDMDESMQLLLEMFPASCTLEVAHCLSLSSGNVDRAAQLILHRQETGESILNTLPKKTHKRSKKKGTTPLADDKQLKDKILDRFSYVDEEDDKREHKPTLPKQEPRKLVRYLDSRVVSTRGDRWTEIKRDEDEEMKKTYVNLKPARQYRFH